MPLIEIRQLSSHTRLGLWRIDHDPSLIGGSPRQRERAAAQLLIDAMMGGEEGYTIGHETSGKPFVAVKSHSDVPLKNWRISISHTLIPSVPTQDASAPTPTQDASAPTPTQDASAPTPTQDASAPTGFVAIILSDGEEVGVDVERRSDRVERIASRFIRPDEQAGTTEQKLLLWSAKETVYKLFSEDHLQLFDMRATAINDHYLHMENLKRNIAVDVCYEFTDGYVLTFATLPAATTPSF